MSWLGSAGLVGVELVGQNFLHSARLRRDLRGFELLMLRVRLTQDRCGVSGSSRVVLVIIFIHSPHPMLLMLLISLQVVNTLSASVCEVL